jgi:hypothetical protein
MVSGECKRICDPAAKVGLARESPVPRLEHAPRRRAGYVIDLSDDRPAAKRIIPHI